MRRIILDLGCDDDCFVNKMLRFYLYDLTIRSYSRSSKLKHDGKHVDRLRMMGFGIINVGSCAGAEELVRRVEYGESEG